MKKITVLCILILSAWNLNAQDKTPAPQKALMKFYVQGGSGMASREGVVGELGIHGVLMNRWSAALTYQEFTMDPKNMPADYKPETGIVLFIPYTNHIETEMKIVSLSASKYWRIGKHTWFTAGVGLSYVSGDEVSYTRATNTDPVNFIFGINYPSNYSTKIERKSTVGGIVRADLEWALTSWLGVGATVFGQFNSIQSPVGFEINLITGLVERHKKKAKVKH
jgi:hypothetical protein